MRTLLYLAIVALIATSSCSLSVSSSDSSSVSSSDSGSEVPAEVEQEINALIDDWLTAWNTGDGQLALGLFAVNGRYASALNTYMDYFDGWSTEEIAAGVTRHGGSGGYGYVRVGSPSIIERPNGYHVAARIQKGGYEQQTFEMFNFVEEDGSLKIRHVEPWYPLGLMQLAEGLQPQAVAGS